MPTFTMPAKQSQISMQHLESNIDHQHQPLHRRRQYRYSRNPIAFSPQYQAYRARQSRDGNQEDAKWPEILELAFLDALIDIPAMGRRKFSYKGKPHGRNELIKEYIWIAYLQSLPPGQRPDPSMARDRKQVSSHIQVLKGFLKDHPAFGRLFPSNKSSKNGFEDSFNNDPCLRALSQGRLPTGRYENFNDLNVVSLRGQQTSTKPAIFWLLVTSAKIQEDCGDLYERDSITHRYARLSSQAPHGNLESILCWCEKFPYLEPLYRAGELDCDIIHMDVALNLMETHAQEGADLVIRSEMSVTGGSSDNYEWQTVTSLIMPPELCRGSSAEQLLEANVTPTKILFTNASETRLKVRFPVEEWAHIFTRLTDIQLKYEGSERCQTFGGECFMNAGQPAEKYLQQVSMYQEVQSCSGPGMPFIRRAIIIWTFRAAMAGEKAETTWRYVDATPSPSGMSPSSISSHQLSASTTDNFNAWINSPSELPIQRPDALDPYMRGLVTQPSAAEFRSAFAAENYGYHDKQFTVPLENFSFEPITRADGEPSLINNNITTNIGACLSNSTNMSVDSFDHSPPDWNIPPSGLLNAGPSWPGYAAIPSNAPNIDVESGATNNSWHIEMDPRLAQWTEYKDGTGGWAETDPAKQKPIYIEQTDDKLLSWLDPPSNETKDVYIEAEDVQLPILPPGLTDMKGPSWMDSDSNFDLNQLVDRLRG